MHSPVFEDHNRSDETAHFVEVDQDVCESVEFVHFAYCLSEVGCGIIRGISKRLGSFAFDTERAAAPGTVLAQRGNGPFPGRGVRFCSAVGLTTEAPFLLVFPFVPPELVEDFLYLSVLVRQDEVVFAVYGSEVAGDVLVSCALNW